ncbi:MAG: hypothetical protein GOMPHAMPRED_006269 [Gomphillus americanus]|uniref:Uncharacterized protein n=1 Tax=Gomphillus americanus TaxID=1940652 RepID=A0A8H3HZA0_9LECA|nr:MAG: hypothetical protein GOMPHAMPRED_006269 [Gomphillus americanus]
MASTNDEVNLKLRDELQILTLIDMKASDNDIYWYIPDGSAVKFPTPVAAGASAGVSRRDLIEAKDTQEEVFGCYCQNSYSGTYINTNAAQQYDSVDGTVLGHYSYCFGDDESCELQCGVSNLEVLSAINKIPDCRARIVSGTYEAQVRYRR